VSAYEIRLHGCDDCTEFVMELTDAEAETARRIAALTVATSEFGCQPTMTLTPATEGSPDD
jgi:hypothetical protein